MFENIIYDQLFAALKPSLTASQKGFINGKSTMFFIFHRIPSG